MMHEEDKDLKGDTSVTGRLRQIPTKPGQDVTKPTFAAGAVPVSYTHLTLPTNREV